MTTAMMNEVQAKIQRVDEMISNLRSAALASPRPSIFANIRALEKEQRFLQQEFEHFAFFQEEDVYRYRVLNTNRPTLVALSEAWKSFQDLFTATYQALKYGQSKPEATSRKKMKNTQLEALPTGPLFGWGYSYQGSVGVGLTLPRKDGGLWDDTDIERATDIIFDLASSPPERIAETARRLGPATVNAMYKWTEVHARNHFGVGVEWRRDLLQKRELLMPSERVIALRDSLAKTTIETQIIVDGDLEAVDVTSSKYRLRADDGEDYSGTYTDAITREHAAVLPARYSATITKVAKAVLLPDEEDIYTYKLVRLTKLS